MRRGAGQMSDIRKAVPADAAAIAAIWNAMIQGSTATFTTEPKTERGIAALIAERPFLVLNRKGVLGFASFGPFRAGPGYARSAEHTVILAPAACGHGHGARLLTALEALAREAGKHILVAGISGENDGAIRFHTRMGYAHAGTVREAGRKFDRWLDLVLMQKIL